MQEQCGNAASRSPWTQRAVDTHGRQQVMLPGADKHGPEAALWGPQKGPEETVQGQGSIQQGVLSPLRRSETRLLESGYNQVNFCGSQQSVANVPRASGRTQLAQSCVREDASSTCYLRNPLQSQPLRQHRRLTLDSSGCMNQTDRLGCSSSGLSILSSICRSTQKWGIKRNKPDA